MNQPLSKREAYVLEVAREELGHLWFDLAELVRDKPDDVIRRDLLILRIANLSRAVGPTPWSQVPLPLVKNGMYERTYAMVGLGFPPVDWNAVYEGKEGP